MAARLSVQGLNVDIAGSGILNGVDFRLEGDVSIGLVGESGSGKTMLVKALTGLLPFGASATGDYRVEGEPFDLSSKEGKWRTIRGRELGMVMQDPFTALDPLTKCARQIMDGLPKHERKGFDVAAALAEVGLQPRVAGMYPLELSGGMRQRVVIAAALATKPKILVADEATTALDVITQKEILDLLDDIKKRRGMPLIIITHDIKLVYERTERLYVLDRGVIVEEGRTREVISNPSHEYTKALVRADRALGGNCPQYETRGKPILKAENIVKRFGGFTAVDGVSIDVMEGECVGIVGESGSGKTTLARCLVGLTVADSGIIDYFGRGKPQIVFQDPYSSLNPSHTVRFAIEEALKVAKRPVSGLAEIIGLAEIPEELLTRKPRELSGGQRQRVAIARALAPDPGLLICDESVSALDILTQNQILATIDHLRKARGLAVLFITHDLSVVRAIAGRIYVMNEAKVVESGSTEEIFERTKDEYTRKLIDAADYGAYT